MLSGGCCWSEGGHLMGRLTGRQCGDTAGGGAAPAGRGVVWESEVGLGASVWWPTVGFVPGQVSENPTGPCLQASKRLTSSTCFSVPLSPEAVPWTFSVEVSVFNFLRLRKKLLLCHEGCSVN